MSFKASSLAW